MSWVGHLELLKHEQGVSPLCDLPVVQRVAQQFATRVGHHAMATLYLLEWLFLDCLSDPSWVGHYEGLWVGQKASPKVDQHLVKGSDQRLHPTVD